MSKKKGKDIAATMILDDLLDSQESSGPFSLEKNKQELSLVGQKPLKKENEEETGTESFAGSPLNLTKTENIDENDKTVQLDEANILGTNELNEANESNKTQLPSDINNEDPQKLKTHHESPTMVVGSENFSSQKLSKNSSVISSNKIQKNLSTESDDVVRQSVGRFAMGRAVTPMGAALAQSENLRIAQNRILDLEQNIEKLRAENTKLISAGEMIRKKADELLAKSETAESKYQLDLSSLRDEKEILKKSLSSRDEEIDKLKSQLEELDLRLNSTVQKVRVRERELENRLELIKMESTALVHSKDEFILDLKRQNDQLNIELENYRTKGQELNRQLSDKQEVLKRTVKALRIALTMLEGAEEAQTKNKK